MNESALILWSYSSTILQIAEFCCRPIFSLYRTSDCFGLEGYVFSCIDCHAEIARLRHCMTHIHFMHNFTGPFVHARKTEHARRLHRPPIGTLITAEGSET